MRGLMKWLGRGLGALLVAIAGYAAYGYWAWADIPAAEVEAKYGAGTQVALVEGVPLRYRLEGAPAGQAPVLVLIHSHYFEMGMWDSWVAALTPQFTILRYDLPSHGLTGPDPAGVYSVDRDVALLGGLLDQLKLGPVALAGSSMGGTIAFNYAARNPERVQALVLVNSGGLPRATRPSGRKIPGWADQVFPLIPPAALRYFLRWMIADDALVTDALAERFITMWRREGNRAAELARLRQYEIGNPDAALAAVRAPVLVLWGELNPQLPVAMAEQFRAKLTQAARVEVKIYPGAAHVLPIEKPAESAADTLAFLHSIAAATPAP